jgi:hypothetical protein
MGSSSWVYNTASSGNGWCFSPSGFQAVMQKICMVDDKTGYINGDNGAASKTNDGGITWKPLQTGVTKTFNSLHFVNDSVGWMVGFDGTIIRTTDGGSTWTPHNAGSASYLASVRFADDSTGWICGEAGLILKTTDGGESWNIEQSNASATLMSLFVKDSAHIWACGLGGSVVRYTPGMILNADNEKTEAMHFELFQSYPNPFNPSATIKFSIPRSETVTLKIFDILGKEVRTIIQGWYEAGTHSVQFDATGLATGTYMYRLKAGTLHATQRMVLMK